MRFVVLITTILLSAAILSTVAMADPNDAAPNITTPNSETITAPDPGPPPPFHPVINPALIVIALTFGSAAVLWGTSAYVRGKISRKKLIVTTSLLMLLTWGGLWLAMINAPANPEHEAWQQAHRRWKNKDPITHTNELNNPTDVETFDDIVVPK